LVIIILDHEVDTPLYSYEETASKTFQTTTREGSKEQRRLEEATSQKNEELRRGEERCEQLRKEIEEKTQREIMYPTRNHSQT